MKWLLQNAQRRVAFALKNPAYTANAILREVTLRDERFLGRITGTSKREIRAYMNEPISTPPFADLLHSAERQFRTLDIESADLFAKKVLMQYAVARALRPECIVETGVANGVSSAYYLLALQKNGRGRLHSVGLDDPHFLPPSKQPGWLVPSWLRPQWEVHLGDAKQILPALLLNLGSIDLFVHDSDHSYHHMLWEFETAYPALRRDGLLLSDDALWNTAFGDFAGRTGAIDAEILHGVGFLRKSSA